MDYFGWLWVVTLCSWLVVASTMNGMGRKVLNDLERVSLIMLEMGLWEIFVCVWAVLAVFSILAISMARSNNTRKGKATISSMERAIKKIKADTLQTMKKGKGKRKGHSSESKKESESENEEIEAMFAESSEFEREKWVHSVEKRGFHCQQGMKTETFLFTHPIRAFIHDQNLQFIGEEVKGYLPSIVREFYSNLRENLNSDPLLETTVSGKQLLVNPDLIARSLHYALLGTHDKPYVLKAITRFNADLFLNTMCTNPVPMGGLMSKEFTLRKLKPEYALMNKVIHNMIEPKGKDKLPRKEEIQFLYEVMNGKVIDYALVIWCVMRDFLRSTTENRHIPFLTLVINLVEVARIRGLSREKRVLPRLGPITSIT